jgi:separase
MEHNAETCTDGMMVILLLPIKLLMLLCDIDYVQISIDLAHEYVKLGRMERASLVYGQTISTARNSQISEETRVFLFLRFAESSAIIGNVLQRYDV